MNTPDQSLSLRYRQFGDPFETLALETIPLPELEPEQVALKILAAPINPADIGRINGSYGTLATLPATGGLEGVAEIVARGDRAHRFPVGARVLFATDPGSWQTFAVAHEDQLFPAPSGLDDAQAAMFWVNPATAWQLMHTFEHLQPGDWIVQNAATSAVGKLVIQFAKQLGIHTANLVRDPASGPSLQALGADLVVADNRDAANNLKEALDGRPAQLAFNAVGGSSALTLAKLLENGRTLVTYGGMDREPAPFPTRYLIFNDLRLRGFWVSQWYTQAERSAIESLHETIAALMTSASITTEVEATYTLDDWQDALRHSTKPGKKGKILFLPQTGRAS